MLFLSVRGFLDYAEPTGHSRFYAASHVAFSIGDGICDSELTFRSSITRPTDALVYASTATSRSQPQVSGSGWIRYSFPVGLFHPLQHAGLTRRTPTLDSNHGSQPETMA